MTDSPHPSDQPEMVEVALASPVQRILGRFIDLLIIGVIFLFAQSIVDGDLSETPSRTAIVIGLVATIAYEIGMVASLGATLGKLIVRTRIVDDSGRTPPNLRAAIMRWVPNAVSIVPLIGIPVGMAIVIASLIWVFIDPMRRSIFDRLGVTNVISID